MSLMIGIFLAIIGIFLCVVAVPVISHIIHNKNVRKETVFEFPKDLFDYDYPDTKFFENIQEDFEKREKQVYSVKLP